MGYRVFESLHLAARLMLIVLLVSMASNAAADDHSSEIPVSESPSGCVQKVIEGSGPVGCIEVDEDLSDRFTAFVESWRKALSPRDTTVVIRSIEHREKNRMHMLLVGERGGAAVSGPVSLVLEARGDGVLTLVSINESPSSIPYILIASGVLSALYIILGLGLFLRMKRDQRFLQQEEGRWSKRQAFLTFYPIALVPLLMLLPAVLLFLAKDSSYLLSIAYKTGASARGAQDWFLAVFVAVYAVTLVCYSLPYIESLRRGPKSVREAAPARFTRKQIAVDFTKLGLIQAATGFAMWGTAVLLARELGLPMLLSAAISSVIGVVGGQRLFVLWVRRKAVRNLPEDHPAASAAVAAFEQAKASIARKSIAVLPITHWPAPNAFVIGLGRKRCVVAVTEPLLENLSHDEVAAVLLHEYGHVKESHTALLALFISIMATWQLEFLLRGNDWLTAFGMSSPISIFLVRQLVLYVGLFGGLLIPFTLISRWCERRADRFAETLGRGPALASALRKMSQVTETPLEWPRWVRILSTHPSFYERIHTLGNDPVLNAGRK